MNIFFTITVALFVPLFALANVVINEVAWMGTTNSATDEWVEIFNDGSESILLDGWVLSTADTMMNITLSGSVAGGGYYLIERTDDTTVPDVAADLVTPFGSGLSNNGEILLLKNSSGAEVNRVDATDGWPAGDNVTKETMQKSGSGWITAASTPKAANVSAGTAKSSEDTADSGSSSSSSGPTSAYVAPEDLPHIKTDAGKDTRAVVGEEAQFRGVAWGLDNEPLENARYLWNFGDGATGEGQNVGHAYMFPGTYIVRLTISSGRYTAFDDFTVAVGENGFQVSEAKPGVDGWIEFYNAGSEPIHVGNWIIETSSKRFVFLLGTGVSPRSFVVLSAATTKLNLNAANDHIYLYYPNGSYANGLSYIFEVPHGMSISNTNGSAVFTESTPGASNKIVVEVAETITPTSNNQKPVTAPVPTAVVLGTDTATKNDSKKIEATDAPVDTQIEQFLQQASIAKAPALSSKFRETLWFGGSLVVGGLLAVATVLYRRRQKINIVQ